VFVKKSSYLGAAVPEFALPGRDAIKAMVSGFFQCRSSMFRTHMNIGPTFD